MSMFLVGLSVTAVGTVVLPRLARLGMIVWLIGFALIGASQGWWLMGLDLLLA